MKKNIFLIVMLLVVSIAGAIDSPNVSYDKVAEGGYIADETQVGVITILNTHTEEINITIRGIKTEGSTLPNPYWVYVKEYLPFSLPPDETKEFEVFCLIPRGVETGEYIGCLEILGTYRGNVALAVLQKVKFTANKERFTIEEFNLQKEEIQTLNIKNTELEEENDKLGNYIFIGAIILLGIIAILSVELLRYRKAYKE